MMTNRGRLSGKKRIAVIIATYNGENYILEQLMSIHNQTIPPDNVYIFDDCSTDSTTSIIKKFVHDYHLYNWNIFYNTENYGWKRNFSQALNFAQGEYIFISDQDDIWIDTKIERMIKVMEEEPKILCLSSDYRKFSGTYSIGGQKKEKKIKNKGEVENIPLNFHIITRIKLGCTLVVRRALLNIYNNLPKLIISHDIYLIRLACILDGLYYYNEVLMGYRIHENNTSRIKKNALFGNQNKETKLEKIDESIQLFLNIEGNNELIPIKDQNLKKVRKYREFEQARYCFMHSSNFINFRHYLILIRNFYTFEIFLSDILYALGIRNMLVRLLNPIYGLIK